MTVSAFTLFDESPFEECLFGSFDFRFGPDRNSSSITFDCDDVGTTREVELFLTTESGFATDCIGSITVNDTNNFCDAICIDPVAECVDTVLVTLNQVGTATISPFQLFAGSVDEDCSGQPLTFSFSPDGETQAITYSCNNIGFNPESLFVIEANSTLTSCRSIVNVTDPRMNCPDDCLDPVARCEAGLQINLGEDGQASISVDDIYNGGLTVDCDDNPFTLAFNGAGNQFSESFNCNDIGSNSVDLFLITQGGLITSCNSNVQISDPSGVCQNLCFDPIAQCLDTLGFDVNLQGEGSFSARLLYTGNRTVGCDGQPVTFAFDELGEFTRMNFNCNSLGARTTTLFVINADDEFTSCLSVITISDSAGNCDDVCNDPVAQCQENLSLNLNDNGMVSVSTAQIYSGDSLEECDGGQLALSFSSADNIPRIDFNCSTVGDQMITLFARSSSGTLTSCQSVISVFDTNDICSALCEDPVAMCSPDITRNIGSDGTLRLEASEIYSGMMLQDCDGNDIQFSFSTNVLNAARTFECPSVGIQSLNLFVTRADGVQTSCMTSITITDDNGVCCNIIPNLVCQPVTLSLDIFDFNNDGMIDSSGTTLNATDLIGEGTDMLGCDGLALEFSLSSNTNNVSRVFDCSNIGDNTVRLWATNADGFSTFCTTTATVEDNQSQCPSDGSSGLLEGFVRTESAESIIDAELVLQGDDLNTDVTNVNGYYAFENMPVGGNYQLTAQKEDDYHSGLSTLDLVLIQQHIFSQKKLDSPYKLLAADVNENDQITVSDIVDLRKLILGVISELPETDSWRFVSEAYTFFDPENPAWSIVQRDYFIQNFEGSSQANFIGIKMGDVNNDVYSTETRSNDVKLLQIEDRKLVAGQKITIPVFASQDIDDLLGLQFQLEHSDIEIIDIIPSKVPIKSENYRSYYGYTNLSWSSADFVNVKQGEVLFELIVQPKAKGILQEQLAIAKAEYKNELYTGSEIDVYGVDINWKAESGLNFSVDQNSPNPWDDETNIQFGIGEEGMVSLKVYDISGQLVFKENKTFTAGNHSWKIYREQLAENGLYFLEINFKDLRNRQKILLVE